MSRRGLLIAKAQVQPSPDYVRDGLVLFLDGLNQGGVSGKWIDIVGGAEFTLNDNAVATNNSVLLTGGYITHSTGIAFTTIEIVLKKSANSYGMVHQGNSSHYRSITCDTSPSYSLTFGGGANAKRTTFPLNTVFSAVGIYDSANQIYDSIKVNNATPSFNVVTNDWTHASSGLTFGRNAFGATAYSTIDELFAVRMYNRALTDAELTQNYNMDVQRYGL